MLHLASDLKGIYYTSVGKFSLAFSYFFSQKFPRSNLLHALQAN